ncbi:hypothetical protein B0H14DRAFT_2581117 [Mycena olivaceomarginata]|nr:hypothetical protein B0H14DRAFT_2581117 [Mycena olivaceomarginata]
MVVLSSCHHPLVSCLPVFTSLFVNGTSLHRRACQFTNFPPRMPPLLSPDSALLVTGTEDTEIQGRQAPPRLCSPHGGQSASAAGAGGHGGHTHCGIVGWRVAGTRARLIRAGTRALPALMRDTFCCDAGSRGGRAVTCENVECHKFDAKNTFHKCCGCSTTLYRPKECQTLTWKQGGHKTMCKMKQRERLVFFRHLSIRDMWHHLPLLRRLTCSTYPALRSCELLIRIDYTAVPPAYSVVPLAETERRKERRAHPRLPLKGPRRQCGQRRVHTRDRPCGLW